MRNTILGIILALCCLSCKKEGNSPTVTYGIAYAKSGVSQTTPTRGFNSSGEITDAAQIAQLEFPIANGLGNSAEDLAKNPNGFMDTLYFDSQTTARVNDQHQISRYTVTTRDSVLMLTGTDTLTGFLPEIEMSRNIRYVLPDPRVLLFDESINNIFQGTYYFNYKYQNRFLVRPGDGKTLAIPMIAYSWTHQLNSGTSFISLNTMTGPLDPTFFRYIPNGDAVLIREFTLYYTK